MKSLINKVALVTSSTNGIGLATVETLAKNGALVYIAAKHKEQSEHVIESIKKKNGVAKFVYFNTEEPDTYDSMIETVIRQDGKINILVNNYGETNIKLDKDLLDGNTDEFFRIVVNNLQSVYLPCKKAIPHMIRNGGGSIINISTIGTVVPDITRTAYCVSKAAINSLTENIAVQYARKNIRCNAILPGLIGTKAALDNMTEEYKDSFLEHVPLKRVGRPEDIANAVLYFSSDESSYVTGVLHQVAGGYGLPSPQFAEYQGTERIRISSYIN